MKLGLNSLTDVAINLFDELRKIKVSMDVLDDDDNIGDNNSME